MHQTVHKKNEHPLDAPEFYSGGRHEKENLMLVHVHESTLKISKCERFELFHLTIKTNSETIRRCGYYHHIYKEQGVQVNIQPNKSEQHETRSN